MFYRVKFTGYAVSMLKTKVDLVISPYATSAAWLKKCVDFHFKLMGRRDRERATHGRKSLKGIGLYQRTAPPTECLL